METVSTLSIVFICISMAISFLLPVFLLVWAKIKRQIEWTPVLFGLLGFFIFTVIIKHYLDIFFLHQNASTSDLFFASPFLYMLYNGFTLAIFETAARFLIIFFLFKKYRDYNCGTLYGLGHGGLESILLSGFQMANYLIYTTYINTNNFDALVTAAGSEIEKAYLTHMREMLITIPSIDLLLPGLERFVALAVQISLAILVFCALKRKKYFLIGLSVLFQAVYTFPSSLYEAKAFDSMILMFLLNLAVGLLITGVSYYIYNRSNIEDNNYTQIYNKNTD